jgi:hypothetical protein
VAVLLIAILVILFLIYGGFTFLHWFDGGTTVNVTTHS